MKIVDKILKSQNDIIDAQPAIGEQLAEELGVLATDAILGGIASPAWKVYMKRYASNKQQLARLCGEDEVFNRKEWSERCLAYTVLNSTCTIMTRRGAGNMGTLNDMRQEMKDGLDDGLNPATGPLD